MHILILIILSIPVIIGSDIKINSYDGDGIFKLSNEQKTVSGTTYDIETLNFNNIPIYKSTTADNSIAIRYTDTNAVFISTVESKNDKLIIIGSTKGGVKLALRLNNTMKYEPIEKDSAMNYGGIINKHFIKLYDIEIK